MGYEVGLECSGRTIQRVMGKMNYHKCIASRKGWVSASTAKRRFEWAIVIKERYPDDDEDWFSVRFSDEVHYSYGPQGKKFASFASRVNDTVKIVFKKRTNQLKKT